MCRSFLFETLLVNIYPNPIADQCVFIVFPMGVHDITFKLKADKPNGANKNTVILLRHSDQPDQWYVYRLITLSSRHPIKKKSYGSKSNDN